MSAWAVCLILVSILTTVATAMEMSLTPKISNYFLDNARDQISYLTKLVYTVQRFFSGAWGVGML